MRTLPRPVAAALLLGAALTPVTLPAITGAAPACAAATGPHAALVVETGAHDLRLCVALDAPSVSGTHLIELASAQDDLSYGFGSGGQAVCRLAGVGPQGDDCFADYPDFWGYWRGDGHGGWAWSSTGAASTSVRDGDLNGWVWGSGDTGTTHAKPPALGIDDVCVPPTSSAPARSSSPAPPAPGAHTTAPATAAPAATPVAHRSRIARSPEPTRALPTPNPDPSPSLLAAAAAGRGAPPASGPPPGVPIAIGLGVALGAGGWLRLRSRRGADRTRAP